jgi:hypothetical protein
VPYIHWSTFACSLASYTANNGGINSSVLHLPRNPALGSQQQWQRQQQQQQQQEHQQEQPGEAPAANDNFEWIRNLEFSQQEQEDDARDNNFDAVKKLTSISKALGLFISSKSQTNSAVKSSMASLKAIIDITLQRIDNYTKNNIADEDEDGYYRGGCSAMNVIAVFKNA